MAVLVAAVVMDQDLVSQWRGWFCRPNLIQCIKVRFWRPDRAALLRTARKRQAAYGDVPVLRAVGETVILPTLPFHLY